ncbi:hypothetical protein MNV49_007851 [Pseudohyphozyma bogoriensis]|nr:hypothetical protein MNV49_007851 [Pseudohyphozyma bogoriensis]
MSDEEKKDGSPMSASVADGGHNEAEDERPGAVMPSTNLDAILLKDEGVKKPNRANAVTWMEKWGWYVYYVGNSGLGPFNFGPTQFQNILTLSAHNYDQPGVACDYSVACVLPFAGVAQRTVTSAVLVTNGISFAIQCVIFLLIGSYADFGTWRPKILYIFTLLAIVDSFAWMGVTKPGQWVAATVLYVLGNIGYQGSLTFWTAAFPQLARDLPEMQDSADEVLAGTKTVQEHEALDSFNRNRLSNVSFIVCSVGEIFVLLILIGVLYGAHANGTTAQNTYALSVVCAYSAAVWIVCALPWFIYEKRRMGKPLPPGTSPMVAGFKTLWLAVRAVWQLRDTMIYLFLYFVASDCLNTTVTLVSTLQYATVTFDSITLNYLLIVGIAAGAGIFWLIQRHWKLSTKTMFTAVLVGLFFMILWGVIGIYTTKIGYHNKWEFWVYQTYYGLFVCPWYSYSQTMISEFIPPGREYLFFALFGVIGKTSAFIGPFVTSAITDINNNNSEGFWFLLGMCILSLLLLPLLNLERSRRDCAKFNAREDSVLIQAEDKLEDKSA